MTNSSIERPEASLKAKILIFGPGGHGKTRFLGSANQDERTNPILILDYEGGTSSLVGMEPEVDIWRIRTWEDFNKAYEYLRKGAHPYKSIGMDSISEAHMMALFTVLDGDVRKRPNPDRLDENDYGVALTQMRRLIRKFRDLPYHFFCTALSAEIRDPREGTIIAPGLAGKFANEVIGIFECVFYMASAETEENGVKGSIPVLLTNGLPKYRTKTRLPVNIELPPVQIISPTITLMMDGISRKKE